MADRPEHNPYASETAPQWAISKRLVVAIGLLAGVVFALFLRRYRLVMSPQLRTRAVTMVVLYWGAHG